MFRYILDANSTFITVFQIIISIAVVPNVLINLFVIAFGINDNPGFFDFLIYSEILFYLEILLNFFTSYSDPEHYEVIDSLKMIAVHYIRHGNFIVHLLAAFPWYEVIDYQADDQLLRDLTLFKMLRISRLGTSNFIP